MSIRRGRAKKRQPEEILMTDLEADRDIENLEDRHAAGTPGGGSALGGLAGINGGSGAPDTDDLEEAMGSGIYDDDEKHQSDEDNPYAEDPTVATGGPPLSAQTLGRPLQAKPLANATTDTVDNEFGSSGDDHSPLTENELQQHRAELFRLGRRMENNFTGLAREAMRTTGGESSGNLSNAPLHLADLGTDHFNQELSMSLLESESQTLEEISAALSRMDAGTYGCCESCHQAIGKERLEGIPYTRYCIQCSREIEAETERYLQMSH